MGSFKAPKHTLKHAFDSDELAVLDGHSSLLGPPSKPPIQQADELEEEVQHIYAA